MASCFILTITGGLLNSVYDITVAYPRNVITNEGQLLLFGGPREIHFNVRKFNVADMPQTHDEVSRWLESVWREKETMLRTYYLAAPESRHFSVHARILQPDRRNYVCLAGWVAACLVFLALLLLFPLLRYYCVGASLIFALVSVAFNGLEAVELRMHEKSS